MATDFQRSRRRVVGGQRAAKAEKRRRARAQRRALVGWLACERWDSEPVPLERLDARNVS